MAQATHSLSSPIPPSNWKQLGEVATKLVCQIQWIDKQGNPTPDNNPAIQLVRTIERNEVIAGRMVHFSASQWFCICAEHSKQLGELGMHIWECVPLEGCANG
jgi:hypothetical protein